ncbi:BOI-related E3 ubiquitin-protein ligase 1-like [Mercurialis annua]|uniref:BOI-related E3 ubiquitin-protein ligase 1-like n=1 Tax=Mercurialis annua TaxID=3986 RepID=UPI00215ED8E3|nr:BOI-related E3 ubiquitin-protein ligase 1-like [Mercurialis annua]
MKLVRPSPRGVIKMGIDDSPSPKESPKCILVTLSHSLSSKMCSSVHPLLRMNISCSSSNEDEHCSSFQIGLEKIKIKLNETVAAGSDGGFIKSFDFISHIILLAYPNLNIKTKTKFPLYLLSRHLSLLLIFFSFPLHYTTYQKQIRDHAEAKNQPFLHVIKMDCGFGFYQSLACDPILGSKKDTYYVNSAPRKRSRDSINDLHTKTSAPLFSFLDEDIIFQIQQQQFEVDRFITDHNQKVKLELDERKRKQSRMLISSIQQRISKKLNEKDEQMQRMAKLNWVLQERVKNIYVENQIWRDLAQSNEATANSLRTNLEQILAHVSEERHVSGHVGATVEDDVESCCGSGDDGRRTLASREEVKDKKMCRKCGEREASVVLVPCRHLCLCTYCGSTLVGSCPVCDSAMTGTVHLNLS